MIVPNIENTIILDNITDTYYRAELSKEIHHGSSEKLVAYMKLFGYINIFLSALSAAGILILIQKPSFIIFNTAMISVVILAVSFVNTFIASIILYRKDGEVAHEHKITGDMYMEVRDKIINIYNQHLTKQCKQEEIISELQKIRKTLNLLARTSRQTNKASYIKAKKRQPDKTTIFNSLKNRTFPIIIYDDKWVEDIPKKPQ
ncbi:MAG: SLATT domain-containing protein [Desulfobacteraceae bacterium]|nr:SLATT domain-containing protein [Desulfobacteraceae bacterium]